MATCFPLFAHTSVASERVAWLTRRGRPSQTMAASRSAPPSRSADASAHRLAGVEILGWEEARLRIPEWADLMTRSLETNVFLEPAFALTQAQHALPAHRPVFMFVSRTSPGDETGRLIGLCAFSVKGRKFGAVARSWQSRLVALGTPLLDHTHGAEAFDLILAWFTRNSGRTAGVLFPALPASGPTAQLISERAAALGLHTRPYDAHVRAVLPAGGDCEALWRDTIPQKRMKEFRRQYRRLGERGKLTWVSVRDPQKIRMAMEQFLALESRGWKGNCGSALLSDPAIRTFVRAMVRMLSQQGRCRIDSLELDGNPVAMGITIFSGRSAALWKIAYDETFAAYSPGVQFALEFTRRQIADGSIELTDSCAIPDHPMIDRIWPGRMAVCDLLVEVSKDRSDAFTSAGERERLRRRARGLAKQFYHMVRNARFAVPLPAHSPGRGNHVR